MLNQSKIIIFYTRNEIHKNFFKLYNAVSALNSYISRYQGPPVDQFPMHILQDDDPLSKLSQFAS